MAVAPLEKVESEIFAFLEFVDTVYGAFGFEDVEISLGLRPPKRMGSDEIWDRAEEALALHRELRDDWGTAFSLMMFAYAVGEEAPVVAGGEVGAGVGAPALGPLAGGGSELQYIGAKICRAGAVPMSNETGIGDLERILARVALRSAGRSLR